MRTALLMNLIWAVLLFGCDKADDEPILAKNDYEVYSAILDQEFSFIKSPLVMSTTSAFRVRDKEWVYEGYIAPRGVDRDIFDDLVSRNDTIYILEDDFNISPRLVEFLSQVELEAIFENDVNFDGWDTFYTKFPDSEGIIRFSRVGYNLQGTKALVEYAYSYHYLGADGGYIYLNRVNGSWIIEAFISVWAS